MKKTIYSLVTAFLFLAIQSRCVAMISIAEMTPDRAKELGVTLRTNSNGDAGIRVTLEFKLVGELKPVSYVELQIGSETNRIMSAPLVIATRNRKPRP